MFCYVSANKNSRKLASSYWMKNLEIISMISKLKGKKQRMRPLDILSRYTFFLPLIPVNLATVTKPAGTPWMLTSLPSLGQGTLSPIQCTPLVEFPAFPQPLCRQYPIQTELKVTPPTKRIINQFNHLFLKIKVSVLSFLSRTFSQSTGLWKTMWILMLSTVRCETDAAVPHQYQSP